MYQTVYYIMKETTLRKKEQARKLKQLHIMDCAENLMRTKGVNNLSMDALAKAAKIAKGTLYLYFDSKEAVIAQLTAKARLALLELFIKESNKSKDSLDQIRAILWSNYFFYKKQQLYNDLMNFYEANRHLKETDELQVAGQQIHTFILSILEKARKTGKIKQDLDIAAFSITMWGMCVGIVQLIDTKQDLVHDFTGKNADDFYENFVELVIDGVRP